MVCKYVIFIVLLIPFRIIHASEWLRIEADYATVTYTKGLDTIADSLLYIAETSLPQLARKVDLPLQTLRENKAGIILTDAPDFANGYTLDNGIVIFALSSEYLTQFSGRGSWYKQVLIHELAHLIMFQKVRRKINRLGTFAYLSIPRWYWEGVAQYLSEPWNAYRGDLILKKALFDGVLNVRSLYQTNDGSLLYAASHAFVKFLAQQYGDSTITGVLSHDENSLMFDFDTAIHVVYEKSIPELFTEFHRTVTLYYGNRYHDYPRSDLFKEIHTGNFNIRNIIPLSDADSTFIIAMQLHSSHNYISVFESKINAEKITLKKKLLDGCHTDIICDPSKHIIAYGRYHLSRDCNLTTYGFDWYSYNRKTGENKKIISNVHARYAVLTDSCHLVLNETRADGSRLLRFNLNTAQKDTLFETSMPLGRLIEGSGGDIILEGQSENGNRDLFLWTNRGILNLTNDTADDRKPVAVSDSLFVFTKYRYNYPALMLFNTPTHTTQTLTYDLIEYWPEIMDRASDRLYLSKYGYYRKKQFVSAPFGNLRNRLTCGTFPIPDSSYGRWQSDNSLVLPDTVLRVSQRRRIRFSQFPLHHALSLALPVYDDNNWGIFGLSSWFEILQRQILLATFILYPHDLQNSSLIINHLIRGFDLDFSTIIYQGPVFFYIEDNKLFSLIRNYAGTRISRPYFLAGNPRHRFVPSAGLSWQQYRSKRQSPAEIPDTHYGILSVNALYHYHKPTKLYPLLAKQSFLGNCFFDRSLSSVETFSILGCSVGISNNFFSEYFGLKFNLSWINLTGRVPRPQFLGIDRYYQTNIPRDFGYTKSVRGVREDISGRRLLWLSSELIYIIPRRTPLKLLFLPLDNPAVSIFNDYARILDKKSTKHVMGFGIELTFGDMNFRYGVGYARGRYSNQFRNDEFYIRFGLTIPGLSYISETYRDLLR